MNKNNKSLGKRSTNTAALSTAISHLKQSVNPVITTGSVRSNPPATKSALEIWTPRKVRLYLTVPTTANTLDVSVDTIVKNTGLVGTYCQVRLLKVKGWNFTNAGSTTNFLRIDSLPECLESSVSTSVEDVGSSSHLPGVSIEFPKTLASNFLGTSSTVVLTLRPSPFATAAATAQNITLDVSYEFKLEAKA